MTITWVCWMNELQKDEWLKKEETMNVWPKSGKRKNAPLEDDQTNNWLIKPLEEKPKWPMTKDQKDQKKKLEDRQEEMYWVIDCYSFFFCSLNRWFIQTFVFEFPEFSLFAKCTKYDGVTVFSYFRFHETRSKKKCWLKKCDVLNHMLEDREEFEGMMIFALKSQPKELQTSAIHQLNFIL